MILFDPYANPHSTDLPVSYLIYENLQHWDWGKCLRTGSSNLINYSSWKEHFYLLLNKKRRITVHELYTAEDFLVILFLSKFCKIIDLKYFVLQIHYFCFLVILSHSNYNIWVEYYIATAKLSFHWNIELNQFPKLSPSSRCRQCKIKYSCCGSGMGILFRLWPNWNAQNGLG